MTETGSEFSRHARAEMRQKVKYGLKASILAMVIGLVAASCGGAVIQPKPTEDPIGGTLVGKGGGGAIDSVKALTTAFTKLHPTVGLPGVDDVGAESRVEVATVS